MNCKRNHMLTTAAVASPIRPRAQASRRWLLALAALTAVPGCVPSKTVTLDTDPSGASLLVMKLKAGAPVGSVPLDTPTAPSTVKLSFDPGVSYQVEARRPQYFPNKTTVSLDPQSQLTYTIPLTQYERDTPGVSFVPRRTGDVWQLAPVLMPAIGFLVPGDEPESNSAIEQPVQVTQTLAGDTVDYPSLAASPTADVLVYTRAERRPDGSWDAKLYRQPTHGGAAARLTSSDASEFTPAFTYDGDAIIFSSDNASENPTLWRIKVDNGGGTLITNLTRADSLDFAPTAGQGMIVYTSLPPRATESQIWVSRLDGTQAGFLINGKSPQLSPDDKHILFLRHGRSGKFQLWVMDPNGSNLTQLTQNQKFDIADPRWSPDGQWIAYSSAEGKDSDGNANADIWVIAADGSPRRVQLTQNGSFDGSPAWDRNGKTIYFRSNRGGSWNIWRMDLRPGVIDTTTAPPGGGG
jgi:Tol biopolymer transport system component